MSANENDGGVDNGVVLIWDQPQALKRLRGKENRLAHLVGIFLNETPQRLQELKYNVEAGNGQEVLRAAHTIKGVAGNLSAILLQRCAADLELAAREGKKDEFAFLWKRVEEAGQKTFVVLMQYKDLIASVDVPLAVDADTDNIKRSLMSLRDDLLVGNYVDADRVHAFRAMPIPENSSDVVDALIRHVVSFDNESALQCIALVAEKLKMDLGPQG